MNIALVASEELKSAVRYCQSWHAKIVERHSNAVSRRGLILQNSHSHLVDRFARRSIGFIRKKKQPRPDRVAETSTLVSSALITLPLNKWRRCEVGARPVRAGKRVEHRNGSLNAASCELCVKETRRESNTLRISLCSSIYVIAATITLSAFLFPFCFIARIVWSVLEQDSCSSRCSRPNYFY